MRQPDGTKHFETLTFKKGSFLLVLTTKSGTSSTHRKGLGGSAFDSAPSSWSESRFSLSPLLVGKWES